ncbi:MAG: hypothetical protein JST93_37255 [Acidobacteria bacterium]|nr:hypothetical protein [Acidobacteriota bacterium]
MNPRRQFLTTISAAAPAAALAIGGTSNALAQDGSEKAFLGTWSFSSTVSNGFVFRELVSFSSDGVLSETNSFLHTASRQNFAPFGFNVVANASDGFGTWSRTGPGAAKAVFRKMMFDAETGQNFGDLLVIGTLSVTGDELKAQWSVAIVSPTGAVLVDLGPVTSVAERMA